MIASLGMYDRAEVQPSNDRLWVLIRDGLRDKGMAAPDSLTRGLGAYWDAWAAPDLVLSQTCGFPYRARLHGKVALIGTPDYVVAGCEPGFYRSVFVARADDPRGTVAEFDGAGLAFNEDLSQSGWAAPQTCAATMGIRFPPRLRTGGHILSARAVAEGRAEIAGIDAVTWAMIARWEGFAAGLKVVGQTAPTPGLPFIAALGSDADTAFQVISAAIAALTPVDRDALMLRGLVRIDHQAYLAVPTPPTPADLGMT
jgi:ABC-type phosphate/phosphonate transport system substrate-binding protein